MGEKKRRDLRWYQDTGPLPEPGSPAYFTCDNCKHNIPGRGCEAFPEKIPIEIIKRTKEQIKTLYCKDGYKFEPQGYSPNNT